MSENKNEKKLPSEDYYRNQTDKENEKIKTEKATQEEKAEFNEAFSDSDDEDIKTYSTEEKSINKENAKDETSESEAGSTVMFDRVSDSEDDFQKDNIDKTMFFSKLDESMDDATIKLSVGEPVENTRYFSLRSKGKKTTADKNKKNFMQNFRVLSKNREDRTILEAAPVGKGGKTFADSVKAQEGEDIFEAVEKAFSSKRKEKSKDKDKNSHKRERNEKGAIKAQELQQKLGKETAKLKTEIIIYAVLFVISVILTLGFSNFDFYGIAGLILTAVACALSFAAFKSSFKAIKDFNAVADTAVVVMSCFVLIHNICLLVLGQRAEVYSTCVIFACFARLCSDYFRLKGRSRQIEMAVNGKKLSILQRIPVKKDAATFTKNAEKNDEPDIFYCSDAMLDISVDEPESENTRENKYFIFTMSFVLLAALVVGLFCFTTEMTGLSFVTALTASVCILLPVMYDPLSRIIFFKKGEQLLKQGVCISGREALVHIGRSDGFVLDSKDVFSGEVSRFRKSAVSQMDQNDSAVFAALLIKEADSVLAPCFEPFLEQMNIVAPPVENFLYEERLGYSAWVLDRKVLVGNRQMLLNHSISVPSKEQEKAYSKGRYVMYVVVDGEITATFLVSYKVLSSLRRYSRDFNRTGLVLMLTSKEVFLDEEAVAARLSIDASSVKILSSKAASVMEKYNSRYDRQTPTGLLCSDKKRSLMHLIMACYNANAADRMILIMMLLGQLLGFLVLVLSAILNMKLFFNPVAIVVLRILWSTIISYIIERKK